MNHITNQFHGFNKHREKEISSAFNEIFGSLLNRKGIYCSDNLFVFERNLSFLQDEKLMDSFHSRSKGEYPLYGILWRVANIIWAAHNGLQIEGDFVDCGCYNGKTTRVVCDYLNFSEIKNKKYYLYDLFEHNSSFPHHSMPEHSENLFDEVNDLFKDTKNVKLVKGKLPETLLENAPKRIAFLHLDLNNAVSEIATLEVLFDRMVKGSILILDDYGWLGYRDQHTEEKEWFSNRGYKVLEIPTGQGLVIKR